MPATWNRSYRELDRALRALRETQPGVYRHLYHRYMGAEEVMKKISINKNGHPVLPKNTEIIAGSHSSGDKWTIARLRRWPVWVNTGTVELALTALEKEFRGEPYLPPEFLSG